MKRLQRAKEPTAGADSSPFFSIFVPFCRILFRNRVAMPGGGSNRSATVAVLLSALCAALVAGCADIRETITLRADGSGIYKLKYSISRNSADQLSLLMNMAAELDNAAGAAGTNSGYRAIPMLFEQKNIEAAMKPCEKHGARLTSAKVRDREESIQAELRVDFDSLSGLMSTPFFSHRRFSVRKTPYGAYVLAQQPSPAWAPAADAPGTRTVDSAEMDAAMSDFRLVTTINLPAELLESNADIAGLRTASWEFNCARDRNAATRLQGASLQLSFVGAGLTIPEMQYPAAAREASDQQDGR